MYKAVFRHAPEALGRERNDARVLQGMANDENGRDSHDCGMTESREGLIDRHQPEERAEHEPGHGHQVMTPAPPGKHKEDDEENDANGDLVAGHARSLLDCRISVDTAHSMTTKNTKGRKVDCAFLLNKRQCKARQCACYPGERPVPGYAEFPPGRNLLLQFLHFRHPCRLRGNDVGRQEPLNAV